MTQAFGLGLSRGANLGYDLASQSALDGGGIIPLKLRPVLYLDADLPAGFGSPPADNTSLSSWVNLAGGTIVCNQASGGSQPKYKAGVINGRGGVLFDGSNDVMPLTVTSGTIVANMLSPLTTYTVVSCFKRNTIGTAQDIIATRGADATVKTTVGADASNNWFSAITSTFTATTVKSASLTNTTSAHICVTTNDGTGNGINQILDGVLSTSTTATPSTTGSLNAAFVGAAIAAGTTAPWNGYITDLLIYRRILSTFEINILTKYLANLRGISI